MLDRYPDRPEGGPAFDGAADFSGTFSAQADGEGQADPEDHEEADYREVGWPVRGGFSANKGDD